MNKNEKIETAILAGISSLPYIGGGISSIYSSIKNHKESQRIDKFFEVISDELERLDEELKVVLKTTQHDDEYLTMLIENICRKVEKEASQNKQEVFRIFFINSLLNGINAKTFDHFNFFLNALDSLSDLDMQLLILIHKENRLIPLNDIIYEVDGKALDPYYILGSLNHLKSYGFVESFSGDVHLGARDNDLTQRVKISNPGKDFVDFCLRK